MAVRVRLAITSCSGRSRTPRLADAPQLLAPNHPHLLGSQADVQHANTIIEGTSRIGYMSGGRATRWTDEELPEDPGERHDVARLYPARVRQLRERLEAEPGGPAESRAAGDQLGGARRE